MRLDLGINMRKVLDTFKQFKGRPFEWGVVDCCQFASSYIERVTGKNLAERYGFYTTEMGAKRAQTKCGTFEQTMDDNFETVEPAMVQRGNVVMFDTPFGHALGIATANAVWGIEQQFGLRQVKHEVIKAWRVA